MFFLLAVLFSACAPAVEAGADTAVPSAAANTSTPTPHITGTHTTTASSTPTSQPTATPRPRASATPSAAPVSRERIEAPILLYHHITAASKSGDTYTIPAGQFRAQMELLHTEGYHPITTSELAAALRDKNALPDKPVLIVFDDGYLDVYANAYPILSELGFPATMNVIVKSIDGASSVTSDIVRELAGAGWEIGSHSLTHANLTKSGDPIGEICQSKRGLEKILGQEVNTFAFPYGAANPYVIQIVKDCGYTSGGGVGPFTSHSLKSIYFLSRVTIEGGWSLDQFKTALLGQRIDQ